MTTTHVHKSYKSPVKTPIIAKFRLHAIIFQKRLHVQFIYTEDQPWELIHINHNK
jgi:hypothetical protein